MSRQVEVRLHDGGLWLHIDGRPVQPGAKVTLNAAEIATLARDHLWAGVQAGGAAARRHSAVERAAADAEAIQAAERVVNAVTAAGVRAGAAAGVTAGARYALQNTRVRRTVERDANGQITGTVEIREPLPTERKP